MRNVNGNYLKGMVINLERTFTTKKEFYKQFRKKSQGAELFARFLKNKSAVVGLVIFILIVLAAVFAPLIANYDQKAIKIDVAHRLTPPNAQNILGTDEMGRDILARIVHGARISLLAGISSVGVALLLGGTLGAISGYYGGWLDNVIMRSMDVLLCLPDVLLALAIIAAFGNSQINITIAIGLAFMPKMSRIVRSAVMGVSSNEYIENY